VPCGTAIVPPLICFELLPLNVRRGAKTSEIRGVDWGAQLPASLAFRRGVAENILLPSCPA